MKTVFFALKLTILTLQLVEGPKAQAKKIKVYSSRELEFSNPQVYNDANENWKSVVDEVISPKLVGAKMRFRNRLKMICPQCSIRKIDFYFDRVNRVKNYVSWKVVFPDGFWFDITSDAGVVEIKIMPATRKGLKRHLPKIVKYIFKVAKELGLFVSHNFDGACHIHIGVEKTFKGDAFLFRQFVVDFMNHPELSWGGWGGLKNGGVHLLDERYDSGHRARAGFRKAVEDFDREGGSILEFVEHIHEEAYEKMEMHKYDTNIDVDEKHKYFALNFSRIKKKVKKDKRTLEIRTVRMLKDPKDLDLLPELIEMRLNYLKKKRKKIPFRVPRNLLEIRRDVRPKINLYFSYLHEMGADWFKFKKLMSVELKNRLPSLSHIKRELGGKKFYAHIKKSLQVEQWRMSEIKELFTDHYPSNRYGGELGKMVLERLLGAKKGVNHFIRDLDQSGIAKLMYWIPVTAAQKKRLLKSLEIDGSCSMALRNITKE